MTFLNANNGFPASLCSRPVNAPFLNARPPPRPAPCCLPPAAALSPSPRGSFLPFFHRPDDFLPQPTPTPAPAPPAASLAVAPSTPRGSFLPLKDTTLDDDSVTVAGRPAPPEQPLEQRYMDRATAWAQTLPNHIEMSYPLLTGAVRASAPGIGIVDVWV